MGFILSNRIMIVVRCQKFASTCSIFDILVRLTLFSSDRYYFEDNIGVLGKIP